MAACGQPRTYRLARSMRCKVHTISYGESIAESAHAALVLAADMFGARSQRLQQPQLFLSNGSRSLASGAPSLLPTLELLLIQLLV